MVYLRLEDDILRTMIKVGGKRINCDKALSGADIKYDKFEDKEGERENERKKYAPYLREGNLRPSGFGCLYGVSD